MRVLLLFFFLLQFSFSSFSQSKVSDLSTKDHLNQLKEGILLIQIPNPKSKKIQILENSNSDKNIKLANEIKEENKVLQNEIVEGFVKNYDFSTYYFFDAKNTSAILKEEYAKFLKDGKGNLVDFNNEISKNIYLASYGSANIAGETTKYNGKGILIRYINDGKLERILSDTFFESTSRAFGLIRGDKPIPEVIAYLNKNLSRKQFRVRK